ncbi:MAG TPA: hypothetical protein VK821_06565 [Dehalococcoidia bacterium]|nr:hypothetical protein [Dehalococcoidia bacterium]
MHEEFQANYLARFRGEVDLPAAEVRHHLIRDLAGAAPDQYETPRAGSQLWLRLGLRRLGEQMIAASEWLAAADARRAGDTDWSGSP